MSPQPRSPPRVGFPPLPSVLLGHSDDVVVVVLSTAHCVTLSLCRCGCCSCSQGITELRHVTRLLHRAIHGGKPPPPAASDPSPAHVPAVAPTRAPTHSRADSDDSGGDDASTVVSTLSPGNPFAPQRRIGATATAPGSSAAAPGNPFTAAGAKRNASAPLPKSVAVPRRRSHDSDASSTVRVAESCRRWRKWGSEA